MARPLVTSPRWLCDSVSLFDTHLSIQFRAEKLKVRDKPRDWHAQLHAGVRAESSG